MIRVRVALFGPAREAVGSAETVVEVGDGATAGDVIEALGERWPSLVDLLPRSRVAVDQEYVDASTPIGPNDEVAIIPPVGGG